MALNISRLMVSDTSIPQEICASPFRQHDIEVAVLIDHHGGRHQRRPFEKEQIDNEEL